MGAEKYSYNPFITSLYEKNLERAPSAFVTALYGTDILKSEGAAIEFITPIFDVVDQSSVQTAFVTALFTEHPFPWLCDPVTAIAWNYRLELTDGTVFGFTSHDQDLVIDGLTYEANAGFSPTAVETSNNLATDNMELEGVMDSTRIDPADIMAGRFDHAKITVFLCNWKNLSDPMLTVRKGFIGEIKYGPNRYQTEALGLTTALQQDAGELYQKICRADLGDSKCQVNMTALTVSGTVANVYSDAYFSTDLAQADAFFDYGNLTFTSGNNNGRKCEVKAYADGEVKLFIKAPQSVQIGDTFTIAAGCDRNFSTCRDRFANQVNFRGEPSVPGNDYASGYAAKGTVNVVSSGTSPKLG